MQGNADGEAGQPPTEEERRALAQREIDNAAEQGSALEQERYRAGVADDGSRTIGGTLFALAGGAGVQGGGYRLDPNELAVHIQRFERIEDRIHHQKAKWQRALAHASPPSADPPAVRQAKRTRESIEIAIRSHTAKLERIHDFINSMKKAHGGYQIMEDETTDVYRKASKDDSSAGSGDLYKKDHGAPSRADTGGLYEKRDGQ